MKHKRITNIMLNGVKIGEAPIVINTDMPVSITPDINEDKSYQFSPHRELIDFVKAKLKEEGIEVEGLRLVGHQIEGENIDTITTTVEWPKHLDIPNIFNIEDND